MFKQNKKENKDFNENFLPKNRKEVFFDCLKIRFWTFIKIGLVLLIFAIPLIAILIFKDYSIYQSFESLKMGDITEEEYFSFVFYTKIIYYFAQILCIIIMGIGLAGVIRIIRQIVWGEPVFFVQDFIDGIKLNGKHYLLYFLVIGIINFLGRLLLILPIEGSFLKALPFAISIVVLFPGALFGIVETQIYTSKITENYKNGLILYIKSLPKTLLATLILLCPLFLELIPLFLIKDVIVILYVIFLLPFVLMGIFLYCMSIIDKYINKDQFPEIYDKGINRR